MSRGFKIFAIALLLIGSRWTCLAQNEKAVVVKKLDAHSYVVLIDGKRFKAVDNELLDEQAKSFDTLKENLRFCSVDRSKLIEEIAIQNHSLVQAVKAEGDANLKAASLDADLKRSKEDTTRAEDRAKENFNRLIGAQTLLDESKRFIPHGNVGGIGGKLLSFLDGPYGQGLFKLVIPAAQFGRTYFGRCGQ